MNDRSRVLRDLVWQFNLLPSMYCHEDWLPEPLRGLASERQSAGAACHRYLSPWLLSRYKLEQQVEFRIEDGLERLALLDGAALRSLAPAFGLLGLRRVLRHTVDGTHFAALREQSGLEEVGFLLSADVEISDPKQAKKGVPTVSAAMDDLQTCGSRVLLSLVAGSSSFGLGSRLRLKLPRSKAIRVDPAVAALPDAATLGHWVAKELIPREAPQWSWLFY